MSFERIVGVMESFDCTIVFIDSPPKIKHRWKQVVENSSHQWWERGAQETHEDFFWKEDQWPPNVSINLSMTWTTSPNITQTPTGQQEENEPC
jgi:hypothetical protein